MPNSKLWFIAAAFLPGCMTQALAQTPDDGRGRFSMSPVEGGFLRLDRETGAVAMCAKKDSSWVCEPVADKSSPGGGSATPVPGSTGQLPNEEDIDKALDTLERIFKKVKERIKKFETPAPEHPEHTDPAPQGKNTPAPL